MLNYVIKYVITNRRKETEQKSRQEKNAEFIARFRRLPALTTTEVGSMAHSRSVSAEGGSASGGKFRQDFFQLSQLRPKPQNSRKLAVF